MNTIEINNLTFYSYGKNTYSYGMELVSLTYPPKDLVKRVLAGEYRGIFLNPSAPCNSFQFFGVFGNPEQYQQFYATQVEAQIAKKMLNYLDLPFEEFEKKREEFERQYKNWWED